jgi:hypothetical protein
MTTPTAGLNSQTGAPGIPVAALDINQIGGYVHNPVSASTVLYVDPTGPASTTANGTTMALNPGQTFYAIPESTLQVSVAATDANHQFVAVQWQ